MALVAGISKRVNASSFRQRKLNFRQVKQVQKIVDKNKQLKQCWTPLDDASFDSSNPVFIELTQLTEGDDFFERDSDLVRLLSLKLMFTINRLPATTNASVTTARIMVCRTKVGPLTVADMPGSPVSSTQPNLTKYQVLYERFVSIGPYDSDSNGFIDNTSKDVQIKLKFRNRKIPHLGLMYDESVSNTASQKNAVYLHIDTSDTTTMALQGQSLAKYYDKD
jgi:hypothetical protein